MSDDRLAALLAESATFRAIVDDTHTLESYEEVAALVVADLGGVTLSSPDPLRKAARELLHAIDSKAAIVAAGGVGFHNACAALRAALAESQP